MNMQEQTTTEEYQEITKFTRNYILEIRNTQKIEAFNQKISKIHKDSVFQYMKVQ